MGFFSMVAIFIGCIGLLGLVSFMVQQKIKEIGIRKTFGASVMQIVEMLIEGIYRSDWNFVSSFFTNGIITSCKSG